MVGVIAAPALGAGAGWFAVTFGLSTYSNTAFLRAGGSAATLTLTRIGGATVLGTLLELRRVSLRTLAEQLRTHAPLFALPATCLFLANYFNSVSLSRCGARAPVAAAAARRACHALPALACAAPCLSCSSNHALPSTLHPFLPFHSRSRARAPSSPLPLRLTPPDPASQASRSPTSPRPQGPSPR